MEAGGGNAYVGFAGAGFDVERYRETYKSTAVMHLGYGTTYIRSDISLDGREYSHISHLRPHIPKAPFDLALRCEAVSNVPQIQFNDDGVWHDFAPNRVALQAGPWFPFLQMADADSEVHLINHRVDRPRPTKSAGKTNKPPAAPAAASIDGAGAAADGEDE